MEVKTQAILALLASKPVMRAPAAVQHWLAAVLSRGEEASSSMCGLKGHRSTDQLAIRYGLTARVVGDAIRRLGIPTRRHGYFKVIADADLPRLEAELRAKGHPIEGEEVPARSTS